MVRGAHRFEGGAAVAFATVGAFVMIAQQVASKAIRDAFFLSNFPATSLPWVMASAAVASVVVVLLFSRIATRLSPLRVVPILFGISALIYIAEWGISRTSSAVAAVIVYLHITAFGATVISGFWSIVTERFDPHTAKKVIARIAMGATLGGVAGGLTAWQVGRFVELSVMLLFLAALNAVCVLLIVQIGTSRQRVRPSTIDNGKSESAVKTLRDVPYLRHLAVMVVLMSVSETCIDYVFKAHASNALGDAESLVGFFSIFHTVVAVLTFCLQGVLVPRFLRSLGLSGTVATLPVTTALGSVVAVLAPGLGSATALRGASMGVENSFYRSGYELLYTPLPPRQKRPLKTIIDVICDRFGATVGSGISMAAIVLLPTMVETSLLLVAVATSTVSVLIVGMLHSGYVTALANSLRLGSVDIDPATVEDATTRKTLTDSAIAIDRNKLLDEIAKLREVDSAELATRGIRGGHHKPVEKFDGLVRALATLHSEDATEIIATLESHKPLPTLLVPRVVELLERDDVHGHAIRALRDVAESVTGQLCDALLDPQRSFVIRRRIPRVLAWCATTRSVGGLIGGLADDMFEVRYRCGVALYRVTAANPSLFVPSQPVLDAALREAERGEQAWKSQELLDETVDGEHVFAERSANVGLSLEHVLTILSVVLDREPLQLAYRALAAEDRSLRGTGLEYLENVLPHNIKQALWPYLGDARVLDRASRGRSEIEAELLSSMSSFAIDMDDVRAHLDPDDD